MTLMAKSVVRLREDLAGARRCRSVAVIERQSKSSGRSTVSPHNRSRLADAARWWMRTDNPFGGRRPPIGVAGVTCRTFCCLWV
jgi:hypothetical protein